jgi:thioredoxin-dependent peroxiredoxin
MASLSKGDKAPEFHGLNQNNENVSLETFKGKKLIIYFYPKDNTPGCTAESCNL